MITVSYGSGVYTVRDPGGVTVVEPPPGASQACASSGPNEANCEPDESWPLFRSVAVSGQDGSDTLKSGYGQSFPDAGLPASSFGIAGGAGDDKIGGTANFGRDPTEGLDGGPGDDLVDAGPGEDFVDGGGGRDTIYMGPGADEIADRDDLPGRAVDADTYDGGVCPAGTQGFCQSPAPDDDYTTGDWIFYRGSAAVTLNLGDPTAAQGRAGEGDTVRGFELAGTGTGNDTVFGSSLRNVIRTGGGNDRVDVSGDLGAGGGDDVDCQEGAGDSLTRDRDDTWTGCESITTLDMDADDIPNAGDNCPAVANPTQIDSDGDFQGDACDPDDDNDGRPDASDACPTQAGATADGCPGSGGDGGGSGGGGASGQTINGTAANETLVGTEGDDVINCGAGRDRVDGRGGNDVIRCGSGNDRVEGGSGNDRIDTGSGNDRAAGGAGKDRIAGANGNDRLAGGNGADRLRGGRGNDRVSGGAGGDVIAGNQGNDRLAGDGGNDRIGGGPGNDRLYGGPGRDRLNGGRGRDLELP